MYMINTDDWHVALYSGSAKVAADYDKITASLKISKTGKKAVQAVVGVSNV
jgi:hypothetical protein